PDAGTGGRVRPVTLGPDPGPVAGRDRRRRATIAPAGSAGEGAGRAEVQRGAAEAAGRGDAGRPARRPAERRRGARRAGPVPLRLTAIRTIPTMRPGWRWRRRRR